MIFGCFQVLAEETKVVVEHEELEAAKMTVITEAMALDAQRDLDAAMPALIAAENSLKALNKNDIGEVRSMKRPPPGVVYVIESICIVKGVKPNRVKTLYSRILLNTTNSIGTDAGRLRTFGGTNIGLLTRFQFTV